MMLCFTLAALAAASLCALTWIAGRPRLQEIVATSRKGASARAAAAAIRGRRARDGRRRDPQNRSLRTFACRCAGAPALPANQNSGPEPTNVRGRGCFRSGCRPDQPRGGLLAAEEPQAVSNVSVERRQTRNVGPSRGGRDRRAALPGVGRVESVSSGAACRSPGDRNDQILRIRACRLMVDTRNDGLF